MFGGSNVSFRDAVFSLVGGCVAQPGARQACLLRQGHGAGYSERHFMDGHFRQQADFCGGLEATLDGYQTVQRLEKARRRAENQAIKSQVRAPYAEPLVVSGSSLDLKPSPVATLGLVV